MACKESVHNETTSRYRVWIEYYGSKVGDVNTDHPYTLHQLHQTRTGSCMFHLHRMIFIVPSTCSTQALHAQCPSLLVGVLRSLYCHSSKKHCSCISFMTCKHERTSPCGIWRIIRSNVLHKSSIWYNSDDSPSNFSHTSCWCTMHINFKWVKFEEWNDDSARHFMHH